MLCLHCQKRGDMNINAEFIFTEIVQQRWWICDMSCAHRTFLDVYRQKVKLRACVVVQVTVC